MDPKSIKTMLFCSDPHIQHWALERSSNSINIPEMTGEKKSKEIRSFVKSDHFLPIEWLLAGGGVQW